MKNQFTAAFVGVAALCGCPMSTAPDPSAGLGPMARVHAPVLEEQIGGMHLDRDGLWVFTTQDQSRARSYEPGQIVAFGDLDETGRHLFAVVAVQSWGLRLQRLDTDAVELKAEGAIVPLARPDLQTGRRWNFCTGVESPASSECLQTAPPGTRWYVYPLGDDGRAVLDVGVDRGSRKPAGAMPVPLMAIVAVGSLGTDVHQDAEGRRWIAVPGQVLERPTVPRIVVNEACRSIIAGPRDLDAHWSVGTVPSGSHPVEVTSAAFAAGADAFVSCAGDSATISTPGLYRRTIDVPGQGVSAPPFLAAKPVQLEGATAEETRIAARLAAAIATGDWATADFYADRLARMSASPSVDTLLMLSMAALAESGRPEAAVLLGLRAGAREWNLESSGPWVWGMATAQRQLGAAKEAIVRAQSLSDVLDRSGDDLMRGWITYFWTMEQLRKRETIGDGLEALEAHPLLAFAARAEFARRTSPRRAEAFASELESRGLLGLATAFGRGGLALPCPSGDCPIDVYGRVWAGGIVDPEAASRVGYSSLRPGFEALSLEAEPPMAALTRTLAVYPFLDELDQRDAVDAAARASARWVAENCFPASDEVKQTLDRLRRIGIDAALRMADWQSEPNDATMAWLAIRGVSAACESVELLVERANELADVTSESTVPAELLTLWVERAGGKELREVLTTAARYVGEHERGQRCVDWNLALAVDAVRGGRFEDARGFVQATAGCRAQDRFEIDLVAAYLGFQRSGHVSQDFDDAVKERLAVVVHSAPESALACLGAGQLEYHLLPQISEPIAELVRRLPSTLPETGEDDLGVVSAADRLEHAREALAAVTTKMDAGQPLEAARELGFARERFAGLGHAVGLARVRWVDEQLFGGKAAAIAAGDETARKALLKIPKKKTFSEYAAEPGTPVGVRLAYASSVGDEPLIRSLVDEAGAKELTSFCVAPDIAPPGTVLDLGKDGRLEPIKQAAPPAPEPTPDEGQPETSADVSSASE